MEFPFPFLPQQPQQVSEHQPVQMVPVLIDSRLLEMLQKNAASTQQPTVQHPVSILQSYQVHPQPQPQVHPQSQPQPQTNGVYKACLVPQTVRQFQFPPQFQRPLEPQPQAQPQPASDVHTHARTQNVNPVNDAIFHILEGTLRTLISQIDSIVHPRALEMLINELEGLGRTIDDVLRSTTNVELLNKMQALAAHLEVTSCLAGQKMQSLIAKADAKADVVFAPIQAVARANTNTNTGANTNPSNQPQVIHDRNSSSSPLETIQEENHEDSSKQSYENWADCDNESLALSEPTSLQDPAFNQEVDNCQDQDRESDQEAEPTLGKSDAGDGAGANGVEIDNQLKRDICDLVALDTERKPEMASLKRAIESVFKPGFPLKVAIVCTSQPGYVHNIAALILDQSTGIDVCFAVVPSDDEVIAPLQPQAQAQVQDETITISKKKQKKLQKRAEKKSAESEKSLEKIHELAKSAIEFQPTETIDNGSEAYFLDVSDALMGRENSGVKRAELIVSREGIPAKSLSEVDAQTVLISFSSVGLENLDRAEGTLRALVAAVAVNKALVSVQERYVAAEIIRQSNNNQSSSQGLAKSLLNKQPMNLAVPTSHKFRNISKHLPTLKAHVVTEVKVPTSNSGRLLFCLGKALDKNCVFWTVRTQSDHVTTIGIKVPLHMASIFSSPIAIDIPAILSTVKAAFDQSRQSFKLERFQVACSFATCNIPTEETCTANVLCDIQNEDGHPDGWIITENVQFGPSTIMQISSKRQPKPRTAAEALEVYNQVLDAAGDLEYYFS